ncbi:MAG: alpha/beta fold hydrolase [Pseudomonadota bacterium]
MKKILLSLFFVMAFFTLPSYAEILVFVHGYDSHSNTWRNKGIFSFLHNQGWQDAGNLISHPNGILYQQANELKPYRMVTVDLPSEAPIQVQAVLLAAYVETLRKQDPKQLFTLIGHSAGGVVSRYTVVRYPELPIKRLITIASPHLGTGMAEAVELVAKSPVSIMAPILDADIINHSGILLDQLQREEPGSFLFWLNRKKHPEINYFSIIRSSGSLFDKDHYVPSYSQDLKFIPGIRFAQSFPSRGKHQLQYRDAFLIARLVNKPVK